MPRSFSTIGFSLVRGRIWPLRFSDVGKGEEAKEKWMFFLYIELHVMYVYTYLLQKLSASLLSLMKSRPLIGQSC